MVEVALEELHHILDVHSGLDLLELDLQMLIFRRFLKTHDLLPILVGTRYSHAQKFGRRSWPVLIWLDEQEFTLDSGGVPFLLIVPFLHLFHLPFLSLAGTFHLLLKLLVDCIVAFSFLSITVFKAKSSMLLGTLSEQLPHFTFVGEEPLLHREDGGLGGHCVAFVSNLCLEAKLFDLFLFLAGLIDDLVEVRQLLVLFHLLDLFLVVILLLLFLVLLLLLFLFRLILFLWLFYLDLHFFFLLLAIVFVRVIIENHHLLFAWLGIEHVGGVDFRLLCFLLNLPGLFLCCSQ